MAWFGVALILIAAVTMLATTSWDEIGDPSQASACRPLDMVVVELPEDKAEARSDFIAMAQRLNASGKCVIEGSFGRSHGKYYFAVRDGPNGKPYFLRYSREELAAK